MYIDTVNLEMLVNLNLDIKFNTDEGQLEYDKDSKYPILITNDQLNSILNPNIKFIKLYGEKKSLPFSDLYELNNIKYCFIGKSSTYDPEFTFRYNQIDKVTNYKNLS